MNLHKIIRKRLLIDFSYKNLKTNDLHKKVINEAKGQLANQF